MDQKPVFTSAAVKSHMPFCEGRTLLFCQSDQTLQARFEPKGTLPQRLRRDARLKARFAGIDQGSEVSYRPWKLHYTPWEHRQSQRLETGLPANAIECSPAFYQVDDQWHVSFIGGIPGRHTIHYRLYTMTGPALDQLSAAIPISEQPTRAGFVSSDTICVVHGRHLQLTDKSSLAETIVKTPFHGILRVSFCADQPSRLIITGVEADHKFSTLLYQVDDQTVWEMEGLAEAYKPTIWGDHIVFAARLNGDFEDRTLQEATVQLRPSKQVFEVMEPQRAVLAQ